MPDSRSILLVQNDCDASALIRAALSRTSQAWSRVLSVTSCAAAMKLLTTPLPSDPVICAVLIDLALPDCQGIEAFDQLFSAAAQLPVLVLCSQEQEALGKHAVQAGAQDYLLKDRLDDYLLPKAVANMIERAANAEVLYAEKERANVTLNSIGDAVMSCDTEGNVTYLNLVAERLTGWTRAEANGRPLGEVFRVTNATTDTPPVNPMMLAIRENRTVALEANSVLRRRDGVEAAIEDSSAPIHDRRGRVTGAVMVFRDVSSTRALSLRMLYLAQHDSLTDLPNRTLLQDRLSLAMAVAQRHSQKLAVIFLDVDRFKNINDTLGHDVGDQLLKRVSQRLLSCVRGSDTVSRQGGDEFVILLPELSRGQDAAILADKILVSLAAPYEIESHIVHVTASIGIVIFPEDGNDADTLLKNADFAMYHAKENGRSNFQFFREEMNVRALARQAIEDGLRHAVERDELVLHYQPIFDLRSGAPTGVEALLRWRHPDRGLLLPAQFMAIAEESGFITRIGRWVLSEACRQSKAWEAQGLGGMRIAINVSSVELRSKTFVEHLQEVLEESQLAPNLLELELTETFLMQDSSSTALVLRALKDLGVCLALDDFGTGYSSLSHLKGFPIDTLKVDRAFVSELTTNADDASIVRAVITLGMSLNIRVVAEGVETAEQLARLQEYQCPEGQGHFFSVAVPGDELILALARIGAEAQIFSGSTNDASGIHAAPPASEHTQPLSSHSAHR